MSLTLADLNLGPIDSGEVLDIVKKGSAVYANAVKYDYVPAGGMVISAPVGNEAFGVVEGGERLASGSNTVIKLHPNTVHSKTVMTRELIMNAPHMVTAVWSILPETCHKTVDKISLGLTATPAGWTNFKSFSTVAAHEIAAGAEGSVSWDDIYDKIQDSEATAVVLTSSMLAHLKRQRNSVNNARVFDITDETIEGLPYRTVQSSTKMGVVGNFNHLFVSLQVAVDPGTKEPYTVQDTGSVKGSDGTVYNLNDGFAAFGYELLAAQTFWDASFVRIVPAV